MSTEPSPVRHQGELLGALTLTKPAERAAHARRGAAAVATSPSQAGLVLRNVRLTAELSSARELRASRQRIVAAQDEERRKLERNIHDGAQQQLVALA